MKTSFDFISLVHCIWSSWSKCSTSCGPGIKSRTVLNDAEFGGKPREGLSKTTYTLKDCPPGNFLAAAAALGTAFGINHLYLRPNDKILKY